MKNRDRWDSVAFLTKAGVHQKQSAFGTNLCEAVIVVGQIIVSNLPFCLRKVTKLGGKSTSNEHKAFEYTLRL